MPHVTIRILENKSTTAQKAKAAKDVTAALSAALNEDPSHIEINFMELKLENVARAGITALDYENSQQKSAKPVAKAKTTKK